VIPPVIYDGVVSSSTYIRKLIAEGSMEKANEYLGHPHVLTDMVRSGHRWAHLGTPTINMIFGPGVLIPAFGVYATRVILEDGGIYAGRDECGHPPHGRRTPPPSRRKPISWTTAAISTVIRCASSF
jgi:riboflavin kinase/FMN adenylyltransferase